MSKVKVDPLVPSETDNIKSWSTIYPNYLDSTKTVAEGRKIPKEKAVDTPTAREILSVCRHLKLKSALEPEKKYCRDPWVEGRVKVLFRTHGDSADKSVKQDETTFKSKKEMYLAIANLIPKMENRVNKAIQQKEREAEEARNKEREAKKVNKKSGGGGGGKKGKKGGKK